MRKFYKLHHSWWKPCSHSFTERFWKDFLFFFFSVYLKELTIHILPSCCQIIVRYLIKSVSTDLPHKPGKLLPLPSILLLGSWIVAPKNVCVRACVCVCVCVCVREREREWERERERQSHLVMSNSWVAHQAPQSMGFSWQEYWNG